MVANVNYALGGNYELTDNESELRSVAIKSYEEGDLQALVKRLQEQLNSQRKNQLAKALGVPLDAVNALSPGWATADDLRNMNAAGPEWQNKPPDGAWVFPESNESGQTVGFSLRATDGRCGSARCGTKRGLIVPTTTRDRPDPVLIVKGVQNVAACVALGLAVVGRSGNAGDSGYLAKLLKGRNLIVVGDCKAGQGHASAELQNLATSLSSTLKAQVTISLPPDEYETIHGWLASKVKGGLNLNDTSAYWEVSNELSAKIRNAATNASPQADSDADRVATIFNELYRIGLGDDKEMFVVAYYGPNVAEPFKKLRNKLRPNLSYEFTQRFGTIPNSAAINNALLYVQGQASNATPEQVHLRLAKDGCGGIVIDLGSADGQAVIVSSKGWNTAGRSPVLFRRTELTSNLPVPQKGGNLKDLRNLLNVTDEAWSLLLSWLVAALVPDIPHPILLLKGEQGTGKTSAMRMLSKLIDPSSCLVRSQPTIVRDWAVTANGSWVVSIDNVSTIPLWWSDALCKATTGDGWVVRKLYTDGDILVLNYRRVVALTGIDPGAFPGDLTDRLLTVDLERIPDDKRRTEQEINSQFEKLWPSLFGALLDLLAAVLVRLPKVQLATTPRMADFAKIVAAVDAERGTHALQAYLSQRTRVAEQVVENDCVATAVSGYLKNHPDYSGTMIQLLDDLRPTKSDSEWPKNSKAFSGHLRRLAPQLQRIGIEVNLDVGREPGTGRTLISLKNINTNSSPTSRRSSHDAGPGKRPGRLIIEDCEACEACEDQPPTPPVKAEAGTVACTPGSGGAS